MQIQNNSKTQNDGKKVEIKIEMAVQWWLCVIKLDMEIEPDMSLLCTEYGWMCDGCIPESEW